MKFYNQSEFVMYQYVFVFLFLTGYNLPMRQLQKATLLVRHYDLAAFKVLILRQSMKKAIFPDTYHKFKPLFFSGELFNKRICN